MENEVKFSEVVIKYILENEHSDPYALALKKSPFPNIDMKVIVQQIQGRKIAKTKFPFLLDVEQYRYPIKESLEQASSEATALFKAKLIKGSSFVDLTGGMGIDSYLLGRNFESCAYVEPNIDLYNSTCQNFKQLYFARCTTFNYSCEDFLQNNTKKYDWVYIDPSRRIDGKRKTSINNYKPNLVELQHQLAGMTDNVMVKLSPMQDISECVNALADVHNIWVLSIHNEVKELLLHIKPKTTTSPHITAVNLSKTGASKYSYLFDNRGCQLDNTSLKKYLYQPASAIVKAELHNRYASQLGLKKLHANTQLYTSDIKLDKFMGRVFFVKESINLKKSEIKRVLPQMKANVITKNFPLSPQEIIKKYKLTEGGEEYLVAFTDYLDKKVVAVCSRID